MDREDYFVQKPRASTILVRPHHFNPSLNWQGSYVQVNTGSPYALHHCKINNIAIGAIIGTNFLCIAMAKAAVKGIADSSMSLLPLLDYNLFSRCGLSFFFRFLHDTHFLISDRYFPLSSSGQVLQTVMTSVKTLLR